MYDPKLVETFEKITSEACITSKDIYLEITESAYVRDSDQIVDRVTELREHGFFIEMDDFGSGYSSLNMITTIPIDVLKMDMKFIRNMNKDEKSLKLVELVVDIAKFLGVPVVAEGVEDEVQLNTLKEMGCDLIQGYYFSKPVPPEEFEAFIEKEQNS
jgi:EAL domain-containing protein (putative c-di-GMP-specific phosphodiesterase class I)